MKVMKNSFWYYHRKERRAIFVLLTGCMLCFLFPWTFDRFPAAPPSIVVENIPELPEAEPLDTTARDSLFPFFPNEVSQEELLLLGVPAPVARTWTNYTGKGGRFYAPADLKKVYGMPDSTLARILPYARFPGAKPAAGRKPLPVQPPIQAEIDVNAADAAAWQQLRGIGPVLSDRIVRFREKLGGFHSIEQVGETYGLPDSTFQAIRPRLVLRQPHRLLPINELDEPALAAHPYLSWKQARLLVAYREMHGPFGGPDDLRAVREIPAEVIDRLTPYCSFAAPALAGSATDSLQ